MSQGYLHQFRLLYTRLGICFLFYSLCRILFVAANYRFFPGSGTQLINDLFFGLWFDSHSICVTNILFILLSILPPVIFYRPWYQVILKWLFLISNSIFIAFNLVDVGYFPFIHKRSTADLLKQLGGQSDVLKLLPQFVLGYWWLFLFFICGIVVMLLLYRRTEQTAAHGIKNENRFVWAAALSATFLLVFLGLRGGLQRSPIDIINAGAVTSPDRVPIVLNTPFTLLKTLDQQALPEHHFFSDEEALRIFNPIHHYDTMAPKKLNVVVILLESFSKEYCALGRKKSFTPFFDSLMRHGLVFTNAYANSSKSIEGIPAVLSSLPSYMDVPFINSMYANNVQTSFASLLGKEGYETAFFHGGSNGTMNFVQWSSAAGYSRYFGRDEYGNDDEFDGYWGIWDEPFLQYAVNEMSEFKEPFHSAVFTLSSHHPYKIPDKYRNKFPPGKEEFEGALRYADYSLQRFFESASHTSWYNNTLFVLVADHAIISDKYLTNPLAVFTIPVVFYRPDNSLTGKNPSVFFQTDVLAYAMYLVGYNKPFFSFGKDPQKTRDHIACYYGDGYYSTFTDSLLVNYLDFKTKGVYNYVRDSALKNNIMGQFPDLERSIEMRFKGLIQTYNKTMNSNAGTVR